MAATRLRRTFRSTVLCARRLLVLLVCGTAPLACNGQLSEPIEAQATDLGAGGSAPKEPSEDEEIVLEDDLSPTEEDDCTTVDVSTLDIAAHAFNHTQPWQKELYSWTVPEQEAALRETPRLLTVGEIPDVGKGLAMDLVTERALGSPDSLEGAVSRIFEKFRYAWGVPWATRLGPGDEDYGNRLVKMVLRDEAWIGILNGDGSISQVIDRNNDVVPMEQVEGNPERIAALYFVRESSSGGPFCETFSGGAGGYREFIVGNEAMLEEWSIGTDEILQRLTDDIAVLSQLLEETLTCPPPSTSARGTFNVTTTCTWLTGRGDPYLNALALPSDAYIPDAEHLSHLIQTLEGDLFEVDPLVVRPEL